MDGMGVVAETRSITASLEGAREVEMAMLWNSEENEKEVAKEEEEVEKEEKEVDEAGVICFSGEYTLSRTQRYIKIGKRSIWSVSF